MPHGVAHILATFNNTLITIADPEGNVVALVLGRVVSASRARARARRSRPRSPGATSVTSAKDVGMRSVDVEVKGPGGGRESAVRALASTGLSVKSIKDVTPIPHNGCRPRKRRRV